MSSPWKKIETSDIVQNLSKIMLEEQERARKRQVREELISSEYPKTATKNASLELLNKIGENVRNFECDSDATIAKLLQDQLDKEYEEITTLEKRSGDSKISISYSNSCNVHKHSEPSNDSEDEDVALADKKYWQCFENTEEDIASLTKDGKLLKDEEIITILDNINNGRKNACEVKKLTLKKHTTSGGGGKYSVKLPKYVINNFVEKSGYHQVLQQRHKTLNKKANQAIADIYLNEPTRLILCEFFSNELFDIINNIIHTKRIYVNLHASGDTTKSIPKEYAVKIFKTDMDEFKAYNKCVELTYRQNNDISIQNQNNEGCLWAEKEVHNLKIIRDIGLNCLEVVCVKKHIVVTSFIGQSKKSAPRLMDLMLLPKQWQIIYIEIVTALHKLYNVGHLIPNNLSQYSILWWDNRCWFLDVAEFVHTDHPIGHKYLLRGCKNICNFFQTKAVPNMMSREELFKSITGIETFDVDFIKQDKKAYCKNDDDQGSDDIKMSEHPTVSIHTAATEDVVMKKVDVT